MLLALGIFLVFIGALAFLFNLRTSYLTHGGGIGQVPVVAASSIQVPLVTVFGIGLIDGATGWPGFVWWHYVLTWLGLTLCIATMTVWAGNLGGRRQSARDAK